MLHEKRELWESFELAEAIAKAFGDLLNKAVDEVDLSLPEIALALEFFEVNTTDILECENFPVPWSKVREDARDVLRQALEKGLVVKPERAPGHLIKTGGIQ